MKESPKYTVDRLMVIDDAEIDLFITSRLATAIGFARTVLPFRTASDAHRFLKANQNTPENLPEWILLDIEMPLMDCFAFLKVYDKLSVTARNYCNVFVLSSTVDPVKLQTISHNVNIKGIFDKPLTTDQLEVFFSQGDSSKSQLAVKE